MPHLIVQTNRVTYGNAETVVSLTCYGCAIIHPFCSCYRCSVSSREYEVRPEDSADYLLVWYYSPPGDCCAFDECGLLCQEVWWKRRTYLLQPLWGTGSFIFISAVWNQCEQSTKNNHIWTLSHWKLSVIFHAADFALLCHHIKIVGLASSAWNKWSSFELLVCMYTIQWHKKGNSIRKIITAHKLVIQVLMIFPKSYNWW